MEEESNGELAFLDKLLKRNNGNKLPLRTIQYLHTAFTTREVAKKVLFPPCLIEYVPLLPMKVT